MPSTIPYTENPLKLDSGQKKKKNILTSTEDFYKFIAGGKSEEDYMSDMLRAIGTQMAQERNILEEQNILTDTSASTQRASELALAYQGALAAEQGEIGIEEMMKNMRLAAIEAALQKRGQDIQKKLGQQQAESSMWGAIGQGAGTIGGAAILASDIRLKTNINPIGQLWNGLVIYEYNYLWSSENHTGFMAQDIKKIYPEAVNEIYGIKYIIISKLPKELTIYLN